jgi:tRNA pseudouridine55 synthase
MDGIVIIDKPAGWTSHDVVARARRVLRERRIGHTGTLDPFATGVLVLLVGRATRLAQFLAGAEKEYEAVARLGYATQTGDRDGAPRGDVKPCGEWNEERIEEALRPLRGEIDQVPPMYSAKKVKGEKLYELARRGVEIEREAVRVKIGVLEVGRGFRPPGDGDSSGGGVPPRDVELSGRGEILRRNDDGTCDLSLRVVCSAGTYVRALAESIGENLGAGAHLSALRRTRAGRFDLSRAVSLDRLNELAEGGALGEVLIDMNAALSDLPAAHLTGDEARRVRHGGAVVAPREASAGWDEGERVRLCDSDGQLLAIGVYDGGHGVIRPRVTLAGAGGAEK